MKNEGQCTFCGPTRRLRTRFSFAADDLCPWCRKPQIAPRCPSGFRAIGATTMLRRGVRVDPVTLFVSFFRRVQNFYFMDTATRGLFDFNR